MALSSKKILNDKPLIFNLVLTNEDDRLDCSWFNPITEKKINFLKQKKINSRILITLKKIACVSGGKRLPKGTIFSEDSNIPYVRAKDVKSLIFDIDSVAKIPKSAHQVVQNYQLIQNDLVLTIVGTIGNVGLLDKKVAVCDFTENIARIRINNDLVLPKFLLHFLNSEYGKIQMEKFSVGSLQYKLSLKSCRNIQIYIPWFKNSFDIKEQKRILKHVHKIFEESEKKKNKSTSLIKEINNLIAKNIKLKIILGGSKFDIFKRSINNDSFSRLDVLFNHPLREKWLNEIKKYPFKKLKKLAKIQKRNNIGVSDFYRLVGLEQIDEKTGKIFKANEVDGLISKKILLKKGDILISKLQPEKGKVIMIDKTYDGCVGSSELVPLVIHSKEILPEYFWIILRSKYVLRQWEYELTGSSRMRIGKDEIYNTLIPLPSLTVQEKIIKEVNQKIKESDIFLSQSNELNKKAKEEFLTMLIK
ncbi:MAG: restriction endonuclease subunit S [Candidatus Pacebacteria bacterium]|nr:restriction endonuclease subunit S [Candidatus Paceibacterota bacterium]